MQTKWTRSGGSAPRAPASSCILVCGFLRRPASSRRRLALSFLFLFLLRWRHERQRRRAATRPTTIHCSSKIRSRASLFVSFCVCSHFIETTSIRICRDRWVKLSFSGQIQPDRPILENVHIILPNHFKEKKNTLK